MRKILHIFDRTLDTLAVLAFLAMTIVLCLQIFYRYVLSAPLVWATPLSLFLFIWAVWLGGATGIRDRNQIRVELAEQFLPLGVRRILMPCISLACALFLLVVIYKSFEIVELQASAIYDTLPFTRDYLFMVVPIVGSVMFLQIVRVFIRQIGEFYFQDREPTRNG